MRHKTQRLEWRIRRDTVWQVPVYEFSDFHVFQWCTWLLWKDSVYHNDVTWWKSITKQKP